jgi:hypothetical protein
MRFFPKRSYFDLRPFKIVLIEDTEKLLKTILNHPVQHGELALGMYRGALVLRNVN